MTNDMGLYFINHQNFILLKTYSIHKVSTPYHLQINSQVKVLNIKNQINSTKKISNLIEEFGY